MQALSFYALFIFHWNSQVWEVYKKNIKRESVCHAYAPYSLHSKGAVLGISVYDLLQSFSKFAHVQSTIADLIQEGQKLSGTETIVLAWSFWRNKCMKWTFGWTVTLCKFISGFAKLFISIISFSLRDILKSQIIKTS